MASSPKEKARMALRRRGFGIRKEKAYLTWIQKYVEFLGRRPPETATADDIAAFLELLSQDLQLSTRSCELAREALLFLYREVLLYRPAQSPVPMGTAPGPSSAKQTATTLEPPEVGAVLRQLGHRDRLVVQLMYGSGLRLSECLRLRVKDIDLERMTLTVRDSNDRASHESILSPHLLAPLRRTITGAIRVHGADAAQGLEPKPPKFSTCRLATYSEEADAGDPGWEFLFPHPTLIIEPGSDRLCRYPLRHVVISRALKIAVHRASITDKEVTCHTFRHSFAAQLLADGVSLRRVCRLLGVTTLKIIPIKSHVTGNHSGAIRSPIDLLAEAEVKEPSPFPYDLYALAV